MEKKKNYYVPDLEICEFEADSGVAESATVNCGDKIDTWTSTEGDDNWFN